MAKGRKTGGRTKGVPNRTTADARAAFAAVYEGRLSDLDRWLKETGDGFPTVHVLATGELIPIVEKNPGKAADILTRMAEHFIPKLARMEKTITDATDEELLAEVRRRKGEAAKEPEPRLKSA